MSPQLRLLLIGSAVGAALAALAALAADPPAERASAPPGADKSAATRTLEAGAKLLQHNRPLQAMDIHLVGFHPMKDDPKHQVLAHHFCRQVTEDFAQCVLFDGQKRDSRLHGIEYIISERLFATLPEAERRYWHPHNGEILGGLLVAPGIPEPAEKALMKRKLNSYGKTWHLWNTGSHADVADALPLGPARLAWSFNRDGEIDPALLHKRDHSLQVDTAAKRRARAELVPLARPQSGVDALRGAFPGAAEIPGVIDSAQR